MPDLAARLYPWLPVRWVMKNRYDCLDRIKKYNGPLYQTHGTADSLAPVELARKLFDTAVSAKKKWDQFEGLGHNDAPPAIYYRQVAEFLDAIADKGAANTSP